MNLEAPVTNCARAFCMYWRLCTRDLSLAHVSPNIYLGLVSLRVLDFAIHGLGSESFVLVYPGTLVVFTKG